VLLTALLANVDALGASAASAASAAAAAAVPTTVKRPSFAGVWQRNAPFTAGFRSFDQALYKPAYAARFAATSKLVAEGKLDLGASCSPPGMVRTGELGLFEILAAPAGRITILYEFMTQVRRIHLGGKHPEHVDPTVNGHSVAHWEGNTLVVDSVGISEFSFLDRNAAPHSEQLHVIERISLVNANLMNIGYTLEDPEALIRPAKYVVLFKRVADGELIDYECDENPRNPINADGSVGFTLQQTP
jgi:hypothetical protein